MISFVYWGGWDEIDSGASQGTSTALLCATLAGSMIGSIAFGILGDMFGRKKMYGFLLVIIMWATLELAGAAEGSHGSMSIVGWLFVWRFFMGIGKPSVLYSARTWIKDPTKAHKTIRHRWRLSAECCDHQRVRTHRAPLRDARMAVLHATIWTAGGHLGWPNSDCFLQG